MLDGLTLTSSDTAPIACNKSSEVTIVAASGTTNTLTDSAQSNDDSYPDNENTENAVIKCKDGSDVTICGSGTLNITANGKNGIKSGATTEEEGDASLTIRDVILTIDAPVNDAINAEQQLDIENGTLTISGGTVVVWTANTADGQPLDADGTLTVSGGTILAAGGSAGMGVSTSATQPYVIFGFIAGMGRGPMGGSTSALAAKGSSFSIQDSSGSTVYSGTALCSANYVFFSSSKLSAAAPSPTSPPAATMRRPPRGRQPTGSSAAMAMGALPPARP